jgi:hypothetical protein
VKRLLAVLRRPRASPAILALLLASCAGAARPALELPAPTSWTEEQRVEAFLLCRPKLKNDEACRCFVGALEFFSGGRKPTRPLVEEALAACAPIV